MYSYGHCIQINEKKYQCDENYETPTTNYSYNFIANYPKITQLTDGLPDNHIEESIVSKLLNHTLGRLVICLAKLHKQCKVLDFRNTYIFHISR